MLCFILGLGWVGCSPGRNLLPSEPGTKWTYDVRTGFGAGHVEDVRVARRLSVAGTEGFELSGPLGQSRMAWKEGTLWMDRTNGVSFDPPAPLLKADESAASWKGKLRMPFGTEVATGSLSHGKETLKIAGRNFETTRSELSFERAVGTTTITTWFAAGTGIVRQEQRTRGALDLRLEWVAGPARS